MSSTRRTFHTSMASKYLGILSWYPRHSHQCMFLAMNTFEQFNFYDKHKIVFHRFCWWGVETWGQVGWQQPSSQIATRSWMCTSLLSLRFLLWEISCWALKCWLMISTQKIHWTYNIFGMYGIQHNGKRNIFQLKITPFIDLMELIWSICFRNRCTKERFAKNLEGLTAGQWMSCRMVIESEDVKSYFNHVCHFWKSVVNKFSEADLQLMIKNRY